MINRYNANTGRVSRVQERQPKASEKPKTHQVCVKKQGREAGDIWVLAVFFLLYLESRDTDFLIILAVLAFYMFDMGDILRLFDFAV